MSASISVMMESKEFWIDGKPYTCLGLLGKGKGGYSYLVTDGAEQYVLKQIHHEPCDYYTFGDKLASELRDYQRLSALDIPIPKLLAVDHDRERLLKEYIEGPTAYDLVRDDKMDPTLVQQVKQMCEVLYKNGLNIDYFPTNFVLQDGKLYYIDYECNDYMQQWDFDHWGFQYWSKTPAFMEHLSQNNK